MKRKLIEFGGAASFLLLVLLAEAVFSADQRFSDYAIDVSRRSGWGPKPKRPILLIGLDAEVDRKRNMYPRDRLAKVIGSLAKSKARLVVIDVFLDEKQPANDKILEKALKGLERTGTKVLLATDIFVERGTRAAFPRPLEPFLDFPAAPAVWTRSEDGTIRTLEPRLDMGPVGFDHLCRAMATAPGNFGVGEAVRIDFRMAKSDVVRIYPTEGALPEDLKPEEVAGATVVVGAIDARLGDRHEVPHDLDEGDDQPGGVLLAYGAQTLNTGAMLKEATGKQVWFIRALSFAAGLLIPWVVHKFVHGDESSKRSLPAAVQGALVKRLLFLGSLLLLSGVAFVLSLRTGFLFPVGTGMLILAAGCEFGEILHAIHHRES